MPPCTADTRYPPNTRLTLQGKTGFTLLEVILVIFIISLILTVAIPNLVRDNPDTLLMDEARRFTRKLQLANQDATFRNLQIGVLVNPDEYQFYYFDKDKWVKLDNDILKPYKLKNEITVNLVVEGFPQSLETEQKEAKPQIAILSNGEFTPFELHFHFIRNRETQAVLTVDPLGKTKLDLVENK